LNKNLSNPKETQKKRESYRTEVFMYLKNGLNFR